MTHPKDISFQFITPGNTTGITLIAGWYASEWKIPQETSVEKLRQLPAGNSQFQVMMLVEGIAVATGGVYNHVGILDKIPHLNAHKHWLALVYTLPEFRQRGYGAILCEYIQEHAAGLGLKELCLFTHTAESLYRRLAWEQVERMDANGKDVVVMKKAL